MEVVKCKHGHFYDSDKYDDCPICTPDVSTKKIAEQPSLFYDPSISIGDFLTDARFKNETESEKTVNSSNEKQIFGRIKNDDKPVSTFEKEIRNASASNDEKTLGFFSKMHNNADNETTTAAIDPVTGWLVCIKGPHFGEGVPVFSGNNSIGRDNSNRIVLGHDPKISRNGHAFIIYEPKRKEFFLQPGSSSGLTYVNDSFVYGIMPIKEGDRIEIGDCIFMFKPLCGTSFSWETFS